VTQPPTIPEDYGLGLASVCAATLASLEAFEAVLRRLHPPHIPALREKLEPLRARLDAALREFRTTPTPDGLAPFHEQLAAGAALALDADTRFLEPDPSAHPAAGVLAGMRAHARCQETLYPLRLALPPLGRFFVEPAYHPRLAELDPEPSDPAGVGLHCTSSTDDDSRGGFALYVPERYNGERPWPLVVALHGGHGHGGDFLWSWLREARGRGFLLLAPTSLGPTWSLDAPGLDVAALRQMLEHVCERWNVDRARILLTGLSDGATFTLLAGLGEDAPYTALAPVSGTLHPANFQLGNVERARDRRIYLVHGALDWMFPAAVARMTRDALAQAGAELTYREIEDLSHTYPREENDRILSWFDPELVLPGDGS
jgi:phospholipase/carboxylesterase